MNEDIITFETAILASELGLKSCTKYCYDPNDEGKSLQLWETIFKYAPDEVVKRMIDAPTQSQLAKWIRERFNLLIRMYFNEEKMKFEPCYSLINVKTGFCTGISAEEMEFDSFEEANEESLKRTLRFIIEKKIHLK